MDHQVGRREDRFFASVFLGSGLLRQSPGAAEAAIGAKA